MTKPGQQLSSSVVEDIQSDARTQEEQRVVSPSRKILLPKRERAVGPLTEESGIDIRSIKF